MRARLERVGVREMVSSKPKSIVDAHWRGERCAAR